MKWSARPCDMDKRSQAVEVEPVRGGDRYSRSTSPIFPIHDIVAAVFHFPHAAKVA